MTENIYKTHIESINDESLALCKKLILNNELVAFPTETVYGLGGLATSDTAIKRIYTAKGRPQDNPLIVHIHKNYDIESLVDIEHSYVRDIIKNLMPGPLTLVLKSKNKVSSLSSCGLDTLAIRMPNHIGAERILSYLDLPISAPSANVSKHTSPVTATHVYDDLAGKIPLILDGGSCECGIESTVLDVTSKTPVILRAGVITFDMIKNVVGDCRYSHETSTEKVKSPGVKYQHYTPKCGTQMFDVNQIDLAIQKYNEYQNQGKRVYYLVNESMAEKLTGNKLILGSTSQEIAKNLYSKLRQAETVCDELIAFDMPIKNGIDVGIMNRFKKACKKVKKS